MALVNTINFLPQVFQTGTNQRFLGATLDQLVSDSVNVPLNGYIGRRFSPTYRNGDNYVPEPTTLKTNYQLEPSVVVRDKNEDITFNGQYSDLLQSVVNNNGTSNNHQKLFAEDSYSFDGHFDYDKFINYHNYYWLPNGPAAVEVSSGATPVQADYVVTRNTAVDGYTFSTLGGHPNTQITLARGGKYTFTVEQPGFKFWIQSQQGISGTDRNVSTVSTREVMGVKNNGAASGIVEFKVPLSTAQDFYIRMPIASTVDAATTMYYSDIQGQLLSDFLAAHADGFDGINNQLQNKTLLFINNSLDATKWTANNITVPTASRTGVWKINLVSDGNGDYTINLISIKTINSLEKVFVRSGKTYASLQFWLDNNKRYTQVPAITANANYLYYQDSANPNFFGEIKLVDNTSTPIDVLNDIIGRTSYTSPNGVIFTNGLKVKFDSLVLPATYSGGEYYVEGVGTYIRLVPVDQLVVPTVFEDQILVEADYLTVNRSSQDLNPWSRTNRWFHKDVLEAVARYNTTDIDYGPNIQGRRAIIEFEPNLQLYGYGKIAKKAIDIITFESTDAFVNVEGQITSTIEGVTLTTGQRIVFANDYDENIRFEIYEVDIERINSQNFIRLILTTDDPVLVGEQVLVKQGTYTDRIFKYETTGWSECLPRKTTFNQAPLFDLVDANGYSFADSTVYPGSDFAGTKFFGYSAGTGNNDVILGFPLKYQNFNNIGDIVFTNHYDTDSFSAGAGTSTPLNWGYLAKNEGLDVVAKLNNWTLNREPTKQYQVFTKFYDGRILATEQGDFPFVQIDVQPAAQSTVPTLKVYLNNELLVRGVDNDYTTLTNSQSTIGYVKGQYKLFDVVVLKNNLSLGDKIDVLVYSQSISSTAYYEIPTNLDHNPLNENFNSITLGQIRKHYNKLIENTTISQSVQRPVQDINLKAQGGLLLQHDSPAIYAMTFMNDQSVNFVTSIAYARKEYQRFKNKFLSLCETLTTLDYTDPAAGVNAVLKNINSVKNSSFPWYYSDMVPYGNEYNEIVYTVLNTRQTNYEISSIFDDTALSNRAVLVYVNGTQLIKGVDYTFNSLAPSIVLSMTLNIGDILVIRDYYNTDGNFIPETPTKLGLYPKFTPEIFIDTTYLAPTEVLRGHDGSLTPTFGDFRDQYLLELELRIYNNIKADYNNNTLDQYDTIPGKFRSTDYSLGEWNRLLTQNFLYWVGTNNVDYATNKWFDAGNPWTWNYSQFTNNVDGAKLPGSWRAIYNYWFDTTSPNLFPWRMLGISDEPAWWQDRYGPSPYTSGNATLWEDLEAGYIWNGSNSAAYYDTRFARPGLATFIPVDTAGNLLPPTAIGIIKEYSNRSIDSKFAVGQQGPAETAWRSSSDYPYAVQQALALARPAKYFASQLDTSRFYFNPVTGQFSNTVNQKITPMSLAVNGDTTTGTTLRTSGYINWIADSIKNLGIDPVTKLNTYYQNLSVQLAYRCSGFTDKKLISVSAEQTSPGSVNASVIIPDANYEVYLGKPIPNRTISYSAVVVERNEAGYSVRGYNTTDPFFTILPSIANNNVETVTIDNLSVKIYQDSSTQSITIPYGTTFATAQQIADFLISYERHLTAQGFLFNTFDDDLSTTRNFRLSINEFLFWAQQGWDHNTLIVLNPAATRIIVNSSGSVVDEINNMLGQGLVIDQNYVPIRSNHFNIIRVDSPVGNRFQFDTVNSSTIGLIKLNLIQNESTLIFDNVDDFGDVIYIPEQGARQYRLKITGAKTGAWTGAVSPTGYMYSNPAINSWESGKDYRMGDLVVYNDAYYTASMDVTANDAFNVTLWTEIPYSSIQTGLLPALGTNAQAFNNIYDIDNPPVDEQLQMFSSGLIGFRERSYLTDLGMSIPTQTKFYQGYIKQKGTQNAIDALTKAQFNNINSTISTYEEWAFRVGVYGDVNNNQYREFILNQSLFKTNPVAFTYADTYSTGNIVVDLVQSNIYTSSNLTTTSTQLYNDRVNSSYINDLPNCGYVNVQDVDYQIFDITKVSTIDNPVVGKKIWVAKDYNDNWNVLRINATGSQAVKIVYTLDNYAKLSFDNPHSFTSNDYFILENFNPLFDGLYRIVNVPDLLSVTIELDDPTKLISTSGRAVGDGVVYSLDSAVVDYISDLESVRPIHGWKAHDRIWVNNATQDGWGVYTYTRPWVSNVSVTVTANTVTANDQFGSATAISSNGHWLYAGNPGNKSVQVFANVNYDFTSAETISNVNASFGSSIDTQSNLVAIGAPTAGNVHVYYNNNGTHTKLQMLHSANASGNFGANVAISADGHWLYINEPAVSQVQAYYTSNVASAASYTLVSSLTVNATAIKTDSTGSRLFVGAAGDTNVNIGNGNVYVYTRTANAFTLGQTLSSQYKNIDAGFGASLAVDSTAGNLFVGIPNSLASGNANGLVERYTYTSGSYVFKEAIVHPDAEVGQFGSSLSVTGDSELLAVGSSGSAAKEDTTFDGDALSIDAGTTYFVDLVANSGAIYLFEPIVDQTVIGDLGYYSYTEDLSAQVDSGDQFGASVTVTRDVLMVGAPGTNNSAGDIQIYENVTQSRSWELSRQQQARVDINSIGRTFIYNKTDNNILAAIDFIDPAKGKVLSTVEQDIDYKHPYDPALYNAGTGVVHEDFHWGPAQIGKIWWNLDSVRYIDYEQDALIYRLNHWGQVFPGSEINVYEWVESTVLPSRYTGTGTPLHTDDSAYSTYGYVDQSGAVRLKYYFWVQNKNTINYDAGKSNSAYSIAAAIENPASQGVPYATVLRNDTIAIYNIKNKLVGQNSVIHLGNKAVDSGLIHSEYALVQEGNPASTIPDVIKHKLVDSLAGQDLFGQTVPDPVLTPAQSYGIDIRPRQSMFVNRDLAWSNYLDYVNTILASYPIIERRVLTTLNSSEPAPNSLTGSYNQIVATKEDLGYLNTANFDVGYKILVENDNTQDTKWAIYSWSGTAWAVSRVQSYKTSLYWTPIDWYESTYDPTRIPDITVANRIDLGKLTLVADTYIKVLDNGAGEFAVYYVNEALTTTLVGIQNGTLQIDTTAIPAKEKRQIATAIQNEIFIEDLSSDYNTLFFIMIKYALTEQKNLDWVFKTSFISATQYIRKLTKFPAYIADNQNYYLDYINEVTPYRTAVREFVIDYIGNDSYSGDVTDFDVPAYYDKTLKMYRSPSGEQSYDPLLLTENLYYNWYNNYKYKVVDIIIEDAGEGYLFAPEIVIYGGNGTGAKAYSTVNANGQLSNIYITDGGKDFTTIPEIRINGTGTGARAYAVLRNIYDGANSGHNLVRSINTTMKFDRISYTAANTFVFWDTLTANTSIGNVIPANTILVINSKLYNLANAYTITGNTITGSVDFPIDFTTQVHEGDFNNANDRIISTQGNIDLRITQPGLSYPGVVIDGNTYIGQELDAIVTSSYADNLGIDPGAIFVDGGAYVDTFSSYAPDELVPGRMYDSLNLTVIQNIDPEFLKFRFLDNMNEEHSFLRIAAANTTVLSSNLSIRDTEILVADADKLPKPDPDLDIPGYVFINGEKITYWRNYSLETPTAWSANTVIGTATLVTNDGHVGNTYITTGNVYAPNVPWTANVAYNINANIYYSGNSYIVTGNARAPSFAAIEANLTLLYAGENSGFNTIKSNVRQVSINTIAQLRRGVDGTYTPNVHVAGSSVVDASQQQLIPGTTLGNILVTANTAYKATDLVSYGANLTSIISANIGDVISQRNIVSTWTANTYVLTGEYTYNSLDGYSYVTSGNVFAQYFANISANNNPVWTANTAITSTTMYYSGNTYHVTGNVYAQYFANVSANNNPVWTANTVSNSQFVYYSGNTYQVKGNVYESTFANVVSSGNAVLAFGSTAVNLLFAGNVAANVAFAGNTITISTMRVLETVSNVKSIPVLLVSGSIEGLPELFDGNVNGNVGFDSQGFDNTVGTIFVNDTQTIAYITSDYILGTVNAGGFANVYTDTRLLQGNIWYNPGVGYATDGTGIVNSTTVQAEFLKASKG
ncbi:hypothetical protein UFOVP190_56 [uncultured Caudovirales phage]|uniref:Uncharacterized protein n=1 Tax=uncultured Caudovirales phage TaxID=2100421 RepID=A0A6J7WH45_9CAUD|nr:hypothetical protein UFOVP190_56 [uncultured Caudovirales phage]